MVRAVNLSSRRGVISVSGDDREKFLQGIISNDIRKVAGGNIINTFLLTPQGKYIYDFLIHEQNHAYLIDAEKERLPELIKKLSSYKLRSKVVLEDVSEQYIVAQVIDSNPGEAGNFFLDPRHIGLGKRAYIKSNEAEGFFANHQLVGESLYDSLRIERLVPEGASEMSVEGDFPLQFHMNENNGVDFKKGCYVGQEVTTRTFHRGTIRKSLCKLMVEDHSVNLDSHQKGELLLDNEKIGTVILAIGRFCLAHADIEKIELAKSDSSKVLSFNNLQLKVV